jgi:S-adenosylmethionine-diacylglycerol 3-amino-3-carboxypropyl transferase
MTSTTAPGATKTSGELVGAAVNRSKALSMNGALERAFTLAFRNLVYAQIWEDPVIDLEAMELTGESRIATIASGGCNVMSYLTAKPRRIHAVDLNTAHVALNRLKYAAAATLDDYDDFARFFVSAADARNADVYDAKLAPVLDRRTRDYWESRDGLGRRRITVFGRNIYKTGLLGRCIAMAHKIARAYGVDPSEITKATTRDAQVAFFEAKLAPLFDKRAVKLMLDHPMSLYGLGIPPAQYKELGAGAPRMAVVVRDRLRKLACDFDLADNYFAWQAFARAYDPQGPLPLYLQREHYSTIRAHADRVSIEHVSMTAFLASQPPESLDRYVLLDAQDWMGPDDLTQLWRQITRTSRTGARVIFRTAGAHTILPGKLADDVLAKWTYHERRSADLNVRDRSAIYGGFHIYSKADA